MTLLEQKANEVSELMTKRYGVSFAPQKPEEKTFILTILAIVGFLITAGMAAYQCWKDHHPAQPVGFAEYLKGRAHAGLLSRLQLRNLIADTIAKEPGESHFQLFKSCTSQATSAIIDVGYASTEEELQKLCPVFETAAGFTSQGTTLEDLVNAACKE